MKENEKIEQFGLRQVPVLPPQDLTFLADTTSRPFANGESHMSDPIELQQRVNQLEQMLHETRKGLEQQRHTRSSLAKALVAVVVLGSAVVGVRETLAWGGCSQTLPSPLKTFCAGDPALAADINGNFKAVADWLVPKVGKFGTADAAVFTGSGAALTGLSGGNITAGSVASTALATAVVQSLVPPGTIIAYGGKVAPAGWLVCDGSNYAQTLYPALFAVTSTAFGSAVAGNFNVPDLRGRFLRGWDNGANRDPEAGSRTPMSPGGAKNNSIGSVQLDQFKSHTHDDSGLAGTGAGTIGYGTGKTYAIGNKTTAAGGTETRPINAYVNYIIKY